MRTRLEGHVYLIVVWLYLPRATKIPNSKKRIGMMLFFFLFWHEYENMNGPISPLTCWPHQFQTGL